MGQFGSGSIEPVPIEPEPNEPFEPVLGTGSKIDVTQVIIVKTNFL